ncbi:unnamed protein product [Dovyalis caffra]|uniref:Uncharacterized protein n=1 Tax=Dovyalis caffra TaxID=77055 RepID=A0AAV1RM68_9ROSI|nr:unnamed protein product [Dovyalis caffra]
MVQKITQLCLKKLGQFVEDKGKFQNPQPLPAIWSTHSTPPGRMRSKRKKENKGSDREEKDEE